MHAITAQQLTKTYGALTAVNRVSFEVRQGEIFGLLGPNGAGKTTIIKMLSTLSAPTAGDALVWGCSILGDKDAVRRSIGMVFQDPAVDDRLTGWENLDFHARMYGMHKAVRLQRIRQVLDLVGLEDKAHVLMKNYSGGMKRRLEIARGLMHYPKVLFLDEPTLGLDPQTRYHIWEYVKMLNRKEGVTIILTTHYMDEADELCSMIGIIDYGTILVAGTPEQLKNTLGNDLITVRVSDPEKFMAAIQAEPWVKDTEVYDASILVSTQHGEEKIPAVVSLAQRMGLSVTAVSIRKPTLEDVFLHYTGKTIRDEPEPGAHHQRGRMQGHGRSRS